MPVPGNENNFETMEDCVVNCGGPTDHPTTAFSFPASVTASTASIIEDREPALTTLPSLERSTRKALTFCKYSGCNYLNLSF